MMKDIGGRHTLVVVILIHSACGYTGYYKDVLWSSIRPHVENVEPVLTVLPEAHIPSFSKECFIGRLSALSPRNTLPLERTVLRVLQAAGSVVVLSVNGDNSTLPVSSPVGRPAAAVVLFLSSQHLLSGVRDAVNALRRVPDFWDPRAPHLVAVPGVNTLPTEVAREILTELWRQSVVYGSILVGTDESIQPFWWHPYGIKGECSGPETISTRIVHPKDQFKASKMFHLRRLMNLRGCPLKVAAIEWTAYVITNNRQKKPILGDYDGLDIRMLASIAQKMRFNLDFLPDIAIDWTAAADMVIDGRADISIGAQYPDPNYFFKVDPTTPYWIDVVVWWVPAGRKIPRWMNVFLAYSLQVWMCMCFTFVFVCLSFNTVIWYVDSEYRSKYENRRVNSLCPQARKPWQGEKPDAFIVFLILLCITCGHTPYDGRLRFVYMVWVLCSLILNTAYQCELVGSLTTPGMFPGIKDLEELNESNLDIGVVTDGGEYFEWFMVDKFEALMPRYQPCVNVTTCLERSAWKHDMAVGIDKIYVEMMMAHFTDSEGKFLLRYLSDIVFSFSVLMVLPKFSILQDGFNYLIAGLMQSGLVARWWDQIVGAKRMRPSVPHIKPLSVYHLQGAFVILIIGCGLSSVVFVLEWAWKRRTSCLNFFRWKANVRVKNIRRSSKCKSGRWSWHRSNTVYSLTPFHEIDFKLKRNTSVVIRKRLCSFESGMVSKRWS